MKLKIKPFLLSLTFITTSLIVQAQNDGLKEKKIALNDDLRVVYHVKENNVKQGSYYIQNIKSSQFYVRGAYTDNKRSGNWYFYNEAGKPETIYSYQQNKLAFIDSTLLNKLTITIPGEDKEVSEKSQIPVLLSPIKLFLAEMSNNITIPPDHFPGNESLPIQIKAAIDVNGITKYFLIYNHNGKPLEQQIKLKRSPFEIEWAPAVYNKKPVNSEVIINTAINGTAESSDGHRRFRWNN